MLCKMITLSLIIFFLIQSCTKKNKSDEGHNTFHEAYRLEDSFELEQAKSLYEATAKKYENINLNDEDAEEVDMFGPMNITTYADWAKYRLPFVECKIKEMNKRSFEDKDKLKSKIVSLITKSQSTELSQLFWCEVAIGPCESEYSHFTPEVAAKYVVDEKTTDTHLLHNKEQNLVFSGFKNDLYSFRVNQINSRWILNEIIYCDEKLAKKNAEFQPDKK
ncbi:MAG TPA: hypothetical protein VJB34_01520 [Bdellovibrionota bacterium]|nr:hypothetical protein [Bdellovibrionota bacterium]